MRPEDPDPRPGDFDDELSGPGGQDVQVVEASEDRAVSIQVVVSGDEALKLQQIARFRGDQPGAIVAALIRDAAGDGT